ncbi:hypothetical protein [Halobellus inordinatus]|uniref:hypothetical protein n=1 Tax=Halobellus inordinatus TaxID=1126236 RepID=UPI0021145EFE|nr:hypothetical protein [Halobellus ramosii]
MNDRLLDRSGASESDVRFRPSAAVLPGTSLGDNVDTGANTVVFADATIGDGAIVRDCVVGDNSSIGGGVTLSPGTSSATTGRSSPDVT